MAELAAIRARLKDRQVKEGALGTAEASICLDLGLLNELSELEQAQASWLAAQPQPDPHSLAAGAPPAGTPLDDEVEAKKQEIREASLRVTFRALSSVKYQEILNRFDDPEDTEQSAFLGVLAGECLAAVWSGSDKVALSWEEICEAASFAEYEEMVMKALALNRRRQDVPFSLKPSRPTLR